MHVATSPLLPTPGNGWRVCEDVTTRPIGSIRRALSDVHYSVRTPRRRTFCAPSTLLYAKRFVFVQQNGGGTDVAC